MRDPQLSGIPARTSRAHEPCRNCNPAGAPFRLPASVTLSPAPPAHGPCTLASARWTNASRHLAIHRSPSIHSIPLHEQEALAALSSARAPANWIALLSQLLDAAPESRLSPAQAANELLSCEAADPARASGLRAPVQRLSAQYAGTRPTPSFASVRFRHHPLSLSGSRPLLGSDESRTLSLDT